MTEPRRRPVDLSPQALLRAGVGGALAFSPEAAGARSWTLAARRADLGEGMPGEMPPEEQPGPVATVRILGPLRQRATLEICDGYTDGYDAIEARFASALAPGVTDVCLVIDSLGGECAGGIAAARRMRAAADRAGVRMWSVADECATSMGFVLLMLGDKGRVHCPVNGLTVSAGVVSLLKDVSGALDKEGIKVEIIRSGDRKMRPSGVEPIDDGDRALIQGLVDSGAEEMWAWIEERRGIALSSEIKRGGLMTGAQALAVGLIDGTNNSHEVMAMATAEASLAAVREALGLAANASHEQITASAREANAARAELPVLKKAAAEADARAVALEEAQRKAAAEHAKAAARAAFASEVRAHVTAGRVSPAGEGRVLAHYDRHGEESARDTLATMLEAGPLLPARARGGEPDGSGVKGNGAGALTPEQKAEAKRLGVSEELYLEVLARNGKAA